jgi:hypothetical protein
MSTLTGQVIMSHRSDWSILFSSAVSSCRRSEFCGTVDNAISMPINSTMFISIWGGNSQQNGKIHKLIATEIDYVRSLVRISRMHRLAMKQFEEINRIAERQKMVRRMPSSGL